MHWKTREKYEDIASVIISYGFAAMLWSLVIIAIKTIFLGIT